MCMYFFPGPLAAVFQVGWLATTIVGGSSQTWAKWFGTALFFEGPLVRITQAFG